MRERQSGDRNRCERGNPVTEISARETLVSRTIIHKTFMVRQDLLNKCSMIIVFRISNATLTCTIKVKLLMGYDNMCYRTQRMNQNLFICDLIHHLLQFLV